MTNLLWYSNESGFAYSYSVMCRLQNVVRTQSSGADIDNRHAWHSYTCRLTTLQTLIITMVVLHYINI